ncbi:dioxygenase [Piscinibacter sp. HJYY11]|uniref:dioxygenase family protein n=1 Tax=Piscinibacter sp. HJYY11 TaxID=2801333 RepID=UPI00191E7CDF|nr:class III extradiol ring-cleavage dioxygenase [Piscinibacter sp. HJYY11]MBL0727701.1 dioxygenase [Piscinibacter sp. HJYY11]
MDTRPLPALFLSHGSPMMALEPGETGPFLERLGPAITSTFGTPRAILAVSAHSVAREPVLLAGARQHAVHDFGGFPDALYQLRYDVAGAPALATEVEQLLDAAGLPAHRVDEGGLDHGIWAMLRFMFPAADIPVLPLAWVPTLPPAQQLALGEALASLRPTGVLVMGTGSITHNLRRVFAGGRPPVDAAEIPESRDFREWMRARSEARDWGALTDYRRQAPHAADMHPTDEHLLPWFVAAGAGGRAAAPLRLHDAVTYGCLGMDAYAFGPEAPLLGGALTPS